MATIKEVVEWLEHGVPSDFVILKEGSPHFEKPCPINHDKLELSLLSVVRFIYPRGSEEIQGKTGLVRDMIERFQTLL